MFILSSCRIISYTISLFVSLWTIGKARSPYKQYKQTNLEFFRDFSTFLMLWAFNLLIGNITFAYVYFNFETYSIGYSSIIIKYQIPIVITGNALSMYFHIKFFSAVINTEPISNKKLFMELLKYIQLSIAIVNLINIFQNIVSYLYLAMIEISFSLLFLIYEIFKIRKLFKQFSINSFYTKIPKKGLINIQKFSLYLILAMLFFLGHEFWKVISQNNIDNCSVLYILGLILSFISVYYIMKGYSFPLEKLFDFMNRARKQKNNIAKINGLILVAKMFQLFNNKKIIKQIADEIIEIQQNKFDSTDEIIDFIMSSNKEMRIGKKIEKQGQNKLENKNRVEINKDKGKKIKNKKRVYNINNIKTDKINKTCILIYSKIGLQVFEYGNKKILSGFDSELLGGFLSAFQSFSLEFQNEPLQEIVLASMKFLIHTKDNYPFFIISIVPREIDEELIKPILEKVGKEFYDMFGKNFEKIMSLSNVFSEFSKKIEDVL